jgi:hypothetical protein
MNRLRSFLYGVWEFVVGDDWVTAVGVVLALSLTALLATATSAWWLMPPAVVLLLAQSVWREARRVGRGRP